MYSTNRMGGDNTTCCAQNINNKWEGIFQWGELGELDMLSYCSFMISENTHKTIDTSIKCIRKPCNINLDHATASVYRFMGYCNMYMHFHKTSTKLC